jgi:hypothetical protein
LIASDVFDHQARLHSRKLIAAGRESDEPMP